MKSPTHHSDHSAKASPTKFTNIHYTYVINCIHSHSCRGQWWLARKPWPTWTTQSIQLKSITKEGEWWFETQRTWDAGTLFSEVPCGTLRVTSPVQHQLVLGPQMEQGPHRAGAAVRSAVGELRERVQQQRDRSIVTWRVAKLKTTWRSVLGPAAGNFQARECPIQHDTIWHKYYTIYFLWYRASFISTLEYTQRLDIFNPIMWNN